MKKRIFSLILSLTVAVALFLPVAAYAASTDVSTEVDAEYVFDVYGLLTNSEQRKLENRAEEISEQYGCGVYIVIVDDYEDYAYYVETAAEYIYEDTNLGMGSKRDGVMLLLSMHDRDYDIVAYGYGNTAFTDYGKERVAEEFKDDFRSNDWYNGLNDYLNICERYLGYAENGKPVDVGHDPEHIDWGRVLFKAALIVLVPMIVAGIVVGIFWSQMKSVRLAGTAAEYVAPGGLDVQVSEDVYTHTSVNRIRRERSSNSGGGGTSVNSGGFSHSSGKF